MMQAYNTNFHFGLYGKNLTAKAFNTWVKKFCKTKGYIFNPHKKGGYDKSNSMEYYTIADAAYVAEQTKLL